MIDVTRRRLLKAAALLPVAVACDGCVETVAPVHQRAAPAAAAFVVQPDSPGRTISNALASLSYETLQVVEGRYLSARNRDLVQLFRALDPHGILRIGGNSSDWTIWSETPGAAAAYKPDGRGPQQPYVLRPEALHQLAGFLRATGWKLVFGVNLKIGLPAMGAALAAAVKAAVGDALLAIQIGNEANNFEPNYATFAAAWAPYAKAIRAEHLPIGGPDTGANTDWVLAYARQYGKENVLLSRHYYRGGEKHGSIADIVSGDPRLYGEVEEIVRAGATCGLPFHLSEANSYWSGGRDGVSNAFASALWGADFMLALGARGVASVDFHGGTLAVDQASLGNTVHPVEGGDLTARRNAVTAYYGPIAGDATLGFEPAPLYHGMQLAQRLAGARVVPARLAVADVNLTAYATRRDQTLYVALINKDMHRDAVVAVGGLHRSAIVRCMRLTAPALDSRRGTTFQDAGRDGLAVDRASGVCSVPAPHASAALVTFNLRA